MDPTQKTRDLEDVLNTRSVTAEFEADDDARTISFPFSSELSVARYFGQEVLSHERSAVDLGRLNDSAPLLFNHDPDKVIGVVERAWIDEKERRGHAKVRFSRNDFAQSIYEDVKDKVLRNVSVGYQVGEMEERSDGSAFVASKWTPHEISIVAIAADPGVGVSRSLGEQVKKLTLERGTATAEPAAPAAPTHIDQIPMDNIPDLDAVRAEAQEAERSRIATISTLCRKHGFEDLGRQLVESGRSVNEAREAVLEKLSAIPAPPIQSTIDIPQEERSKYSITAGLRAAMTGDWKSREAGLVRELSRECELQGQKRQSENSFIVPFSALSQRATYVTSGATTGGNLVATDLLADEFIEALRNESIMMRMGVTTLTGLVGDIAIPRRSGVASTYYLSSETAAITQSESTFDQISLTPKHLAALSKYSRQTLIQSTPGIEQLVRSDLLRGMTLAMDLGILNGSGSSGQPTGILNVSGINSVAGGTNGAAITMDNLIEMEGKLGEDNALTGNLGYCTNSKVITALKKLKDSDGQYLYNTDLQARGRGPTPGTLNGYTIESSNQVPSNLTKGTSSGVCSAVLFGNFSDCVVGTFGGGLEITTGEDSDDFSKVLQSVRATMHYDVAVRHPESFCAILDVTT